MYQNWFIRSFIDKKTHGVTHQLYVDLRYFGDWKFFQSAADDNARPLEVVRISSNVDNCRGICTLEETISVALNDVILRARAQTGYPIKISAQRGDSFVLTISSDQIQLQIDAIASYIQQHPK